MTIYQVSRVGDSDGHQGFSYHRTMREARKAAAEWRETEYGGGEHVGEINAYEFPVTADGMIRALNALANHNDNG